MTHLNKIIWINLIITFFTILISCSKNTEIKTYYNSYFTESLSSKIKLEDFNAFGDLMSRIEIIACNDSIASLSFNGVENPKEIHVFAFCPEEMLIFDPKDRNSIYFNNGDIIKNERVVSMDSLSNILEKDFYNFGKNPYFADSPEKLIVIILAQDNGNLDTLKNFLDEITNAYDSIETSESLKIMMIKFGDIFTVPSFPNNAY